MAEDATTTTPPPRQRRSSFAGQTFADLFGTGRPRPSIDPSNASPPTQQYGPISQAAAQAQRRRMSLTTLGLSGSPDGPRMPSYRGRQDSIGSSNSGSIDESAIEDDSSAREPTSTPVTPFARRMSFGARALRDVRQSVGSGGGGGTAQNGSVDFWNENMRNRAQRTSTAGGQGGDGLPVSAMPSMHARSKSIATMEAPAPRPAPKEPNRPDHFQERILKGDFYMD